MDLDLNRETQVWQRVASPPSHGQSREELNILLMAASERATLFRELAGQNPKAREKGKLLRELEQVNIACIRGMLAFAGWDTGIPQRKISQGNYRQNLIRGYYLAKKAAAEYTARSVDPEFGIVYQEMAQRECRICSLVIQMLGEA